MGFLNEEPVITPNLDRFSRESLVLTQAASNYPVCSPYRAMMMSGKYPHSNGVLANCNSKGTKYGYELRQTDECWSDVLKKRGYSLGYIGKWHLEAPRPPYVESYNNSTNFAWNEWCPPERRHGFDLWHSYNTFDRHMTPEYWSTEMSRDERLVVRRWGPEHETDLAIRYIRNDGGKLRDAEKPFAMVVSMNPPHTPYNLVPDSYVDRYSDTTLEDLTKRPNIPPADSRWGKHYRKHIRNYFSMITGVDEQFGRILKALEESGQSENTIVVFTSDHGDCVGIHDHVTKNVHWEESMRVPFLVRWPGRIKPRQDDLLISTPDIYPTILELMGHQNHVPREVQGVSHARLFRTGEGPRPSSQLYLWLPDGNPELGRRGVRTHEHTLMIETSVDGPTQRVLHDNVKDPYQMKNIAERDSKTVNHLVNQELKPWLEENGDPWEAA